MKTVLISIFDSNMVRNILRTEVLRTIVADISIDTVVLLVHPKKCVEYKKEFETEKVQVVPYDTTPATKLEQFFWFLLRNSIHTKNVRTKIDELLFTSSGNFSTRLIKHIAARIIFSATKVSFVDMFLRRLTIHVHNEVEWLKVLEKYSPNLVFLPTIFGNRDIQLLKACRSTTTPTLGMIKSWDNLIGKDPLLIWPDRLVVHNEIVKQYAISMHSYPEERIFISGLPQLDVYVTNNRIRTRDQFLSSLGIDPKALLIVYSAVGKLISYHEPEVIQYLSELIGSGGVVKDAHLLVRLHPAYPSDEGLLKELPNTTIIRPGRVGVDDNPLRFDFEFDSEETTALMETLKWADVLIQSGSTMAIDAACFDTPIISLGFDGYIENEKLEFSNRRLLIKDHYQRILDTGGTKEVYTEKELISAIQEYIRHPEADKAGRARIVDEQCYRLDGKSGRRVGEYILTYLQQISA